MTSRYRKTSASPYYELLTIRELLNRDVAFDTCDRGYDLKRYTIVLIRWEMRSFIFFNAVYWRRPVIGSVIALQPPDIRLPTATRSARGEGQRVGIFILLGSILVRSPCGKRA